MRRFIGIIAACGLAACSPQNSKQNPRDRAGVADGAVTWRVVTQADGHAAFLSRPGAAPDLVLWCRDSSQITLRAHIFASPSAQPDLKLETPGGRMAFSNVRRQGGVRAGDRILVEGSGLLNDPKVGPLLEAGGELALMSGGETYKVAAADPDKVLSGFVGACKNPKNTDTKSK